MGGMIPISDASRRPTCVPVVTILIILANGFVFVLELMGGEPFVTRWSVTPADITAGHHWITILTAMFMHSRVPNLGASGAIAAVMGAFLVTYPRDQIMSVLFIGWFAKITFIPAALLIGLWFVIQLFNAVSPARASVRSATPDSLA